MNSCVGIWILHNQVYNAYTLVKSNSSIRIHVLLNCAITVLLSILPLSIFIIQGIPALVTIGLLLLINNPKSPSTLPDPLAAGWKGESVCEVVQEDAKIRVLRCTFPPGVGHEEHEHAPHFGYTVKGSTFEVKDKYSTRKVKVLTGSHFYKPVTSVHEIQNIGDSTAVFLIIEQKNTYQ